MGNQLLNNYKKFLLAYERAWRHVDIPAQPPPPSTVHSKKWGTGDARRRTRSPGGSGRAGSMVRGLRGVV